MPDRGLWMSRRRDTPYSSSDGEGAVAVRMIRYAVLEAGIGRDGEGAVATGVR